MQIGFRPPETQRRRESIARPAQRNVKRLHILTFEVIAAFGFGFIALGLMLKLPPRVIGIIGLAIICLHDLVPVPGAAVMSPAGPTPQPLPLTLLSFLFILLRLVDRYGDPAPWTHQKNSIYTLMSFLNVTKYPSSLQFCLITVCRWYAKYKATHGYTWLRYL